MFWKTLPTRMWLGLLLVAGLAAAFLIILSWNIKPVITKQLLYQQQTIARAETSSIASFFQTFGNSIAVLSQLGSMESRGKDLQSDLDAFVDQWSDSGLVGGVILTDKAGIVLFNSSVSGVSDVGADLSDRDYFTWAKSQGDEGKYFVGRVVISRVGSSKGQVIAPVTSPIYKNGVFLGVISASVKLKPLTMRFLGLMNVSDVTNVYLFDHEGDFLYSSNSEDTFSANIFADSKDPFLGSQSLVDNLKEAVDKSEEDSFTTSLLNRKSGESMPYLVSYSPILLEDRNWLLVMTSPIQQVADVTTPIYVRQAAIFLLLSLSVLFYGVVIAQKARSKEIQA